MSRINELIGKKFGKLTVLYRANDHISKNGHKRIVWHCKCECGNELDVMALNLTRNHSTSCGCARADGRKILTLDITGQRFGNLIAIKKVENENNTGTKWLFRCDCGNETQALLQNVKSGKTKSCGKDCSLKKHALKNDNPKGYRGDLIGFKQGILTVIDFAYEKNGYKYWLCQCECGNKKAINVRALRRCITKSCGCLQKKISSEGNKQDLIGKRFGKLVVIDNVESKYRKKHWLCKCDCGNQTIVSTSGLKSGHTQSCGCYQDEVASNTHFIDLTGKRFGKLQVLSRSTNSNTGLVRYNCICDCGKKTIVAGGNLAAGNIQSCGCWKYSKLEELVIKYFQQHDYKASIDYDCQKKFKDLLGTGNMLLSYDFVVYNENKPILLIECQGQQHYTAIEYFGGESQFKNQVVHDNLKRDYAKKINVKLLEIPYTCDKFSSIENILDETFKDIRIKNEP